jgi:hypothetical protein
MSKTAWGFCLSLATFLTVSVQAQQQPSGVKTDSKIVQAKAVKGAAAPAVTLIDGERVRPEEAMVFTRSVLLEEGPGVAVMSQLQENINTVRHNMNTYRLGYALPAEKVGERFVFSGPVKGWRATSTGDVSAWPPATYPVTRTEAMRRAKLLEPILLAEPIDEMNNLRVYYLPSLVGHNGQQYTIEPTALAFFIHPGTGYRMTALIRAGRTYGSVNKPLAATSHIYVQHTQDYPAGPLGLGRAYVPSMFYSKRVQFDMEPFAQGDSIDRLMAIVLAAKQDGPLAVEDFRSLHNEMARYTGGNGN